MNEYEYASALANPLDHVQVIGRPHNSTELRQILEATSGTPRAGIILLDELPADELVSDRPIMQPKGAGRAPDELLYVGLANPGDGPMFSVPSSRDGLWLVGAENVAVVNLTARGNHYAGAVNHQHDANHGLVQFSNGRWEQVSGAWREVGFYGHGFVAAAWNTLQDFGTAIGGYGTGGFFVTHNDVEGGGDWGREGLSGISFVRLCGNSDTSYFTGSPFEADFVYWENHVRMIRQRVNSTKIGHGKPTDGNGLIIGDSERAPGKVLISGNRVGFCDGAGINVYRGPRGGGDLLGNSLDSNYLRRDYPTAAPDPDKWGGQILLQREPGDPGPVTYRLSGNSITSTSHYGPQTENVKLRGVTAIEVAPEPVPVPDPDPSPEPVPDPDEEELADLVAARVRVEVTQTIYPLLVEILETLRAADGTQSEIRDLVAEIREVFS